MKNMHDADRVSSIAFVIMPDHIHWLIQLSNEGLNKIMHAFKGVSAKQINQHHSVKGKFWQASYHDHAVRKEEDLAKISSLIPYVQV